VKSLDAAQDGDEIVYEEAASADHVREDACRIPPFQQRAATGLVVEDPEGNKIFGVYTGVEVEEGAELFVRVVPWEAWAGHSWRYFLRVEVCPGLATC